MDSYGPVLDWFSSVLASEGIVWMDEIPCTQAQASHAKIPGIHSIGIGVNYGMLWADFSAITYQCTRLC